MRTACRVRALGIGVLTLISAAVLSRDSTTFLSVSSHSYLYSVRTPQSSKVVISSFRN